MLQYDLTGTRFFTAEACSALPSDAEIFAITAALLLLHDVAYCELAQRELELTDTDIENVAQCVEYRLPVFTRDLGSAAHLRQRLADYVGLRIAGAEQTGPVNAPKST